MRTNARRGNKIARDFAGGIFTARPRIDLVSATSAAKFDFARRTLGRARHFPAEDDVGRFRFAAWVAGYGGLPGISRRAKLNRISRGIKWYLTDREDAARAAAEGLSPPSVFWIWAWMWQSVYTIFGLMGSSRGMPGNYENNYYPRARRTRVLARRRAYVRGRTERMARVDRGY